VALSFRSGSAITSACLSRSARQNRTNASKTRVRHDVVVRAPIIGGGYFYVRSDLRSEGSALSSRGVLRRNELLFREASITANRLAP